MFFSIDKPISKNFNKMNTNTSNSETQTTVIPAPVVSVGNEEIKVHYAIALMFFEYLGYVSPLIEWAAEMCEGKELPKYKKSIIRADALSIFELIKKECPIESVKNLYKDFYAIILHEYATKIKSLETASTDDLPF